MTVYLTDKDGKPLNMGGLKKMDRNTLLVAGIMDGMPRDISGDIMNIAQLARETWSKKKNPSNSS